MTVIVTSEKFVYGPGLVADTVHTKVGHFWQPVLASVTPVQYLASPVVYYFLVDQPYQLFLTVIEIAAVSTRRGATYGIRLEETFKQHIIACARDSNGFQEILYFTYLNKLLSKHSASLQYDSDVILAISFQNAPVIEHYIFLAFVPGEKFSPLRFAHLVHVITRDVWDRAFVI